MEAARKASGLNNFSSKKFDYEAFYANELEKKHKDKSYRYFNNINRVCLLLRVKTDYSSRESSPMRTPRIPLSAFAFGEQMIIWECHVTLLSLKRFTTLSTVTAAEQAELAM